MTMPDLTIEPLTSAAPARTFADLGLATVVDDEHDHQRWIPLVPLGEWDHPQYGHLEITLETIQRMHANHQAGLPGTDLPIDIDHSWSHSEAAGWLIRTEPRADGLWGLIEFNDWGLDLVRQRRYRYISPEWMPDWKDPRTGEHYEDVLTSIALTNRPFFKDLPALVAAESDRGHFYVLYQFIWEEKGSEIRYRVRDPGDFRSDTFRSKDMPGVKGVRMILARLKKDKVPKGHDPEALVLQALRFDKEQWTMERAKEWVAAHKDKLKAAASAADDEIRRGAADNTGGTRMTVPKDDQKPEDEPKGGDQTPKPGDQTPKPDSDPGAGAITASEAKAMGERITGLETRNAELERKLALAELKERIGALRFGEDKQRALPPAVVDQLAETALKFAAGEDRDKWLKGLEGLSFVELGERGVDPADADSDPEVRLQQAIAEKIKANQGMSYADAMRAVAAEQPKLVEERDRAIRGHQPKLRTAPQS